MQDTLKQFLMAHGAPATEAQIASDLAEHAAHEAAEAMSRVCETAPENLRAMVMILAAKIVVESFGQFMKTAAVDIERNLR